MTIDVPEMLLNASSVAIISGFRRVVHEVWDLLGHYVA